MIDRNEAFRNGNELGRLLQDDPIRWGNALRLGFLVVYLLGFLSGAVLLLVFT